MTFSAFAGIEGLAKKPAKKSSAKVLPPEPQDLPAQIPVRTPRVTPVAKQERVARIEEAEATSGALMATTALGKAQITQLRREQVLAWMLNGHQYEGQLMTLPQLADALETGLKIVENDVAVLKQKMADYHVNADQKDIPAMAYMLMEMKFQDRGRALALYNIVMEDIKASDERDKAWQDQNPDKVAKQTLSGRDRAAMYNAALQAMDLAGKATNGMDQLFKLTGGVKKLEKIIQQNTQIITNNYNTVVQMGVLHEFAATALAGILPSSRKITPQLETSEALELTEEDNEVLNIANE